MFPPLSFTVSTIVYVAYHSGVAVTQTLPSVTLNIPILKMLMQHGRNITVMAVII
jgi:hypothetical protein